VIFSKNSPLFACPVDLSIAKHAEGTRRKDLAIVDDHDKSPPTNAKASRLGVLAVIVGEKNLPIEGTYNNTDIIGRTACNDCLPSINFISDPHGMCLLHSDTFHGGFFVFNMPSIRKASLAAVPNSLKVQFSKLCFFFYDNTLSKPCAMAHTGVLPAVLLWDITATSALLESLAISTIISTKDPAGFGAANSS